MTDNLRYSITILFLLSLQINFAQDTSWQNEFLLKGFDSTLYQINTNRITRYHKDSIIDYEIEKLPTNQFVYTDWKNLGESEIEKIETYFYEQKEDQYKIVYYKDGSFEKGFYSPYFKGTYRKGYWMVYDNKNKTIGYGKYKKFIRLRTLICLVGEDKPTNLKHGEWKFIGTNGNEIKVIKYRKGKIRKTTLLISSESSF